MIQQSTALLKFTATLYAWPGMSPQIPTECLYLLPQVSKIFLMAPIAHSASFVGMMDDRVMRSKFWFNCLCSRVMLRYKAEIAELLCQAFSSNLVGWNQLHAWSELCSSSWCSAIRVHSSIQLHPAWRSNSFILKWSMIHFAYIHLQMLTLRKINA